VASLSPCVVPLSAFFLVSFFLLLAAPFLCSFGPPTHPCLAQASAFWVFLPLLSSGSKHLRWCVWHVRSCGSDVAVVVIFVETLVTDPEFSCSQRDKDPVETF